MKKLNVPCNKVLPTVYDDALSYYEVLCKVVAAVNELIENSGGLPTPSGEEGWIATIINGEWKASGTIPQKVAELVQENEEIVRKLDEIYEGLVEVSEALDSINRTVVE